MNGKVLVFLIMGIVLISMVIGGIYLNSEKNVFIMFTDSEDASSNEVIKLGVFSGVDEIDPTGLDINETHINYQINQYSLGNGKFMQTSSLGNVNYYNGDRFLPIETKIINSSDSIYEYEVTKGVYQSYFKEDPTEGQVVKFVSGSDYITYQPMALSYRNDFSQLQQIEMINEVIGIPNENEFLYEGAYGNGIDLKYSYWNDYLREELIINSLTDLIQPEQYIIDGGNPTLDLDFILTTNSKKILINGDEWDKKKEVETSNEVFIMDDNGSVLYYLKKPYAYDSNDSSQLLKYNFRRVGNDLFVTIKTPYSWLNDSSIVYPISIDPDTGAALPGTAAEDSAIGTISWNNINNILADDTSGASAQTAFTYNWDSYYLKATNYSFSIPSGNSIDGIIVNVSKQDFGSSGELTDNEIKIVKSDGSIGSENKASVSAWPGGGSYTWVIYGSDSDLWSESWAYTDINDVDFGVVLSAHNANADFATASVNTIVVKVYYSEAPSDTCTYSAGNWNVDCSDNCVISSPVDVSGNEIFIIGTGTFVTTVDITGYNKLHIRGTDASNICRVTCKGGGCFK